MNFKSSFLFAKKMIFSKDSSVAKKSMVGALVCIGLSLVPLVVILTVSNGMIEGITERLISLSSSHIEAISLVEGSGHLEEAAELAKKIPGITNAYPVISTSALAISTSSNSKSRSRQKRCGVNIRAVPKNLFDEDKAYKTLFESEDGNIADFAAAQNAVLIGKGIAQKLGIGAGDTIRLVATGANKGSPLPALRSYKVCAVISCGYQELDSLWLFMNFSEGRRISAQSINSIMMETDDAFSPDLVLTQEAAQRVLGNGFRVRRWDEQNRSQYENFSSTKILLIFIQLLIVLVACVNISSALIMLVLERRREIAILKSLGGSDVGIASAFLLSGFACGVCGVLIGVPVGLLLSVNINAIVNFSEKILNLFSQGLYFFLKGDIIGFEQIRLLDEAYYLKVIPVEIPFGELFLIGLAPMCLSLATSLLPAIRAGRQRPLETLRGLN